MDKEQTYFLLYHKIHTQCELVPLSAYAIYL